MADPSIPPPSPPAPHEAGPSLESVAESSFPLIDDSTDQERAIRIESSEVYAQVLEHDWEAVVALGMTMDLKHPLAAYPLRGEHTPPHVGFLFPYLVAQLILGNSRGVLVRLTGMESIVSQHPVFQSLQTVAYTLETPTPTAVFPAINHLESVIRRTHDPRFDPELKDVALSSVRGLTQTCRARAAENIGRAYTAIPADTLGVCFGYGDDREALDGYVRSLGWPWDPQSGCYRPFPSALDQPRSTHFGFDDLKYLSTETMALDAPM